MGIEDFKKKAILQDKRNVFEETNVYDSLPVELKEFYQKANPIDVEITMRGYVVRFVAANDLSEIQTDYGLGEYRFVFATCNGDPIYVYMNKIYTCCHGIGCVRDELVAENFLDFLDLID